MNNFPQLTPILARFSPLLLLPLLLAGCGNSVQDDLLKYVNEEIPRIISLENAASAQLNLTFEMDDDAAAIGLLQSQVKPAYEKLLTEAQTISPATKEVGEVHAGYIDWCKGWIQACDGIVAVIVNPAISEAETMSKAVAIITDQQSKGQLWVNRLKILADQYGVELTLAE